MFDPQVFPKPSSLLRAGRKGRDSTWRPLNGTQRARRLMHRAVHLDDEDDDEAFQQNFNLILIKGD